MRAATEAAAAGVHAIRIQVVRDFRELWPLRHRWNALVRGADTNTIFQTYEWHASWWKVFGGAVEPLVLLAECGDELVGIAPMVVAERTVLMRRQRVIEFIGTRVSDYCDFIVSGAHPHVLIELLTRLADTGFDLLHLRDIPESSRTLVVVPAFFHEQQRHVDLRALYEAPSWLFGDPAADRQLANKKSLRRHYNFFHRTGRLEFTPNIGTDDIPSYLERLFAQHIGRWAETSTPSLFIDQRMQDFFRELARTLAPTGWLLFSVVHYDGRPIALHFGFQYGNRIIWYKPAFDVEYAKRSPGEVLIKYLLEYALEQRVEQFDFTIGEDDFKYRFANHTPKNHAIRIFTHRRDFYATRAMLHMKAWIEGYPSLARMSRRIAGGLRDHLWM